MNFGSLSVQTVSTGNHEQLEKKRGMKNSFLILRGDVPREGSEQMVIVCICSSPLIRALHKEWFKWYGVSPEDQLWYLNKRRELLQKYDQRNAMLKALQLPTFDLDTNESTWSSKESNVLSMKSTTGPFEKSPTLGLLGGSFSHQGDIPRPALSESVRQFRSALIEGRMELTGVAYKLLTATDVFAKLEFTDTLKLVMRGPRLIARASTIANNILRCTMNEMLSVPFRALPTGHPFAEAKTHRKITKLHLKINRWKMLHLLSEEYRT